MGFRQRIRAHRDEPVKMIIILHSYNSFNIPQ